MKFENKKLETKKSEIRYTTSDPKRMLGKYIGERLLRGWKEDFIDEDTGETVSIDRYEVISNRGVLITGDLLSQISFFLQSGDITEVIVSNQKREAFELDILEMYPWLVVVMIGNRKRKFILYATSVNMAIEITKDYIEQKYSEGFYLLGVKNHPSSIILRDTLAKRYPVDSGEDVNAVVDGAPQPDERKFYQIETKIFISAYEKSQMFIVETKDVDRAILLINDYVAKTLSSDVPKDDFKVMLETVKILPCSAFIERDFSQAYADYK